MKQFNLVRGEGLLQHHFWGQYAATIVIRFVDYPCARDAKKTLGSGWNYSEKDDIALIWHGKDSELEFVLLQLESYGAPRDQVTSIDKSIDYGECFSVTIPVVPEEQLNLFS